MSLNITYYRDQIRRLELQQSDVAELVIDLARRIRFLRSIETDPEIIEAFEQIEHDARAQLYDMTRCRSVALAHISSLS